VTASTAIAARGIDISALPHVVNFDVPNQPDDYIHRVGRTARASLSGHAITFASPEDGKELAAIERAVGKRLPRRQLAGFDYAAQGGGRLEIPLGERIAAIRARKAEERARARAKADARAQREGGGRPAASAGKPAGHPGSTPARNGNSSTRPAHAGSPGNRPSHAPARSGHGGPGAGRPATAGGGHAGSNPWPGRRPDSRRVTRRPGR
jgi:ATP-dependent RNA helicase RhlE